MDICKKVVERLAVKNDICITHTPKFMNLKCHIEKYGYSAINNTKIHNCEYGIPKITNEDIDGFINSSYYYHFNATIRRSYPVGFSGDLHREKYLINYYMQFWKKYIHRDNKFLIIWDAPHFPHEFILLYLAKKNNYKIIIISVMAGDRVFLMDETFKVLSPAFGSTIEKVFNREFDLFQKQKHDNYNNFSRSVKSRVLTNVFTNYLSLVKNYFSGCKKYKYGYYGAVIGNDYYSQYRERIFSFKNSLRALRSLNYYEKLCQHFDTKEDIINIFIPLTCKYENSVDPLWGSYDIFTIITALNQISNTHNKKIRIFIKEHPLNFVHRAHQYYPRDLYTYRTLVEMENVCFISTNLDSFSIMRRVDFVLSGGISTIALQCIALDIPMLTIGVSPFYPDVKLYETLEKFILNHTDTFVDDIKERKFIDAFFQLDNISPETDFDPENLILEVIHGFGFE